MNYLRIMCLKILLISLLLVLPILQPQLSAKTFRIAANAEYISFDPTVAYDWLGYQTLAPLCGFLLVLNKSDNDSLKPVFDIANTLKYENNNKTLLFTIKEGRKFHDGKEITAHDIAYSLNRVTHPALKSPGSVFFKGIIGYNAYQSGKKDHLMGVQVLDKYTLQIELVRPSYAFIYALTTNFACILPKGTPIKALELPVISSGSYQFEKFENKKLRFKLIKKNQLSYKKPLYQEIEITTGLSTKDVLAGFASNQYDVILDSLLWTGTNNRKNWEQKDNHSFSTTYITMNTTMPPFNDIRVRHAVNHAVNRDKLVMLLSGAATKTTHIVPPGFELFNRMENIYHYNPDKARALLLEVKKEQAHRDGKTINMIHADLYALDIALYRKLVLSIVSDLQAVGLNITPHFTSHDKLLAVAGGDAPVQMVFSDGLGWMADFPDVSNFFTPLLSKAAIHTDGWNWGHYYNNKAEDLAIKADSFVNNKDKRLALWTRVFSIMEKDAPWAALYNRRSTNVYSLKINENESFKGMLHYFPFPWFFTSE